MANEVNLGRLGFVIKGTAVVNTAYKRLDVFPIDTWVKQYIASNCNIKNDVITIKKYAKENFKEYSGLVIQYMFHSERNKNWKIVAFNKILWYYFLRGKKIWRD